MKNLFVVLLALLIFAPLAQVSAEIPVPPPSGIVYVDDYATKNDVKKSAAWLSKKIDGSQKAVKESTDEVKKSVDSIGRKVDAITAKDGELMKGLGNINQNVVVAHEQTSQAIKDSSKAATHATTMATIVIVIVVIVMGIVLFLRSRRQVADIQGAVSGDVNKMLCGTVESLTKVVKTAQAELATQMAAIPKATSDMVKTVTEEFVNLNDWIYKPPIINNSYVSLYVIKEVFEAGGGEIMCKQCATAGAVHNATSGPVKKYATMDATAAKALTGYDKAQYEVVKKAIDEGMLLPKKNGGLAGKTI